MSFLKKREPDNRGIHQLPRQATPPTLKQLQGMLQEATQQGGRICQVAFGDAPEEYSLAVFRDRNKGDVHWALYRGEGESAMMVWDQPSNDPGFIHQLITAQFPGFDLKPVALRPSEAFQMPHQESTLNQPSPTASNYENQTITGRMRGKPTFEGDLKNIQMPNVLQSIAMSKGTGRLEIENMAESATIFFADGAPIHCISRGLEGESSFVELVGWEEGEFRFFPGAQHEQKSIKRRLDTLLMEGSALDDQFRALKKLGVNDNVYVARKSENISEEEFEKKLAGGTGADLELCKRIYRQINDRTRLIELVRRCNLTKPQWVPILFNLANCNLISFHEQVAQAAANFVAEANIDWSQAEAAERALMRADTQLFSYPAFLFFLKNELMRWERFGRPFSVILLQLSASPSGPQGVAEPLSIPAAREIGARVTKLKRKTDIFAHYETFGFALILVDTDGQSGRAFAARLLQTITTEPLGGGLSAMVVQAKAGVACIPDDCSTLGSLLARARPAP